MAVELKPTAAGAAVPTPMQRLDALEAELRLRLGSLLGGAAPLLAEVRELVAQLHPEASSQGQPPTPEEASKRRERLAAALDELEDLLEALLLAARAGGAGGVGASGRA